MKICLIGQNLTNLILATDLTQKKLKVDIYIDNNSKSIMTSRTIAISSNNFELLISFINKLQIFFETTLFPAKIGKLLLIFFNLFVLSI